MGKRQVGSDSAAGRMMETNLIVLGVLQILNILIYGWVVKAFLSQPRFNHPGIFLKPTARLLLGYGPPVTMVILVVFAFVLTESPWLFLGLTVAGAVAFSMRPDPEFLH